VVRSWNHLLRNCSNIRFVRFEETQIAGVAHKRKEIKEAQVAPHEVLFEGLREEEILNLPRETVEQLILLGEPLCFPNWISSSPRFVQDQHKQTRNRARTNRRRRGGSLNGSGILGQAI
jgi:hypothetical protein